jgi:hypothetical protein
MRERGQKGASSHIGSDSNSNSSLQHSTPPFWMSCRGMYLDVEFPRPRGKKVLYLERFQWQTGTHHLEAWPSCLFCCPSAPQPLTSAASEIRTLLEVFLIGSCGAPSKRKVHRPSCRSVAFTRRAAKLQSRDDYVTQMWPLLSSSCFLSFRLGNRNVACYRYLWVHLGPRDGPSRVKVRKYCGG